MALIAYLDIIPSQNCWRIRIVGGILRGHDCRKFGYDLEDPDGQLLEAEYLTRDAVEPNFLGVSLRNCEEQQLRGLSVQLCAWSDIVEVNRPELAPLQK